MPPHSGGLPGLGAWGHSQGSAMQGGSEQGSLWQQSDLLDLVAAANPHSPAPIAAAAPTPLESPSTATASPGPEAGTEQDHASDLGDASSETNCETAHVATSCTDSQADAKADSDTASAAGQAAALLPAGTLAGANRDERNRGGAVLSPSLPPLPAAANPEPASLPSCPQRLLILDTETTDLNPQQGQCIEVGAVLFDVGTRAVLMQVSFLLPCDHNPAQHINGIAAAVSRLSQPWRDGLACFEAMVAAADAVLAHNAAFDRQWFGQGELPALNKPWICSMEDIRWPAPCQLRANPSVRDLALAHGVPVWAAHRALTDCIYLVQVFQRCEELEQLLQAALEPRQLVRARLSYDKRQLAKDAGFRWNEPVPRAWSRRLSAREIAALPFAVDVVEADAKVDASADASVAAAGTLRNHQPWRRSA